MNDFIQFLSGLFGNYTPVLSSDGSAAIGMAGVDFPYVFRAIIFIVVIYSVFNLLGGIICKTY